MRRFAFLGIALFFVLSLTVYVSFYQGQATDLVAQYRRMAPFSESELSYLSVSRPFLNDGVVLYQPKFPSLPLHLKIDRMSLRVKPTETVIRLLNVNLDVAGSLTERDLASWTASIRSYQVPQDLILKPLETLVLLNKDTLKGNIELRIRPQGKNTALTLRFEEGSRPVFVIDTVVFDASNNRMFGWTDGVVRSAHIQIMGADLLRAVAGYEAALGYPVDSELKHALVTGTVYQTNIQFPTDYPVRQLFEGQ